MNTISRLPPAVSGQVIEIPGPVAPLCCYVDGSGPPLLLLHSVNAAASAAEVRPLYDHFKASRSVYALDLPGFGLSAREDRAYTPRLMTDAVLAALAFVQTRHGPAPVDAMALSLGCEFLARAAQAQANASAGLGQAVQGFASLALVSPTGFSGTKDRLGPDGSTYALPWLHRALRGPGWGRGLFGLLTKPAVVRYFLRKTFGRRDIDEDLWAYCVQSARQPGAEHVALAFLSAQMFSADIHRVYQSLRLPVWMSHGCRGDFTDYRASDRLAQRPNWQITRFDTGAMPYFEQPADFCRQYQAFLDRAQAQLQTLDQAQGVQP